MMSGSAGADQKVRQDVILTMPDFLKERYSNRPC